MTAPPAWSATITSWSGSLRELTGSELRAGADLVENPFAETVDRHRAGELDAFEVYRVIFETGDRCRDQTMPPAPEVVGVAGIPYGGLSVRQHRLRQLPWMLQRFLTGQKGAGSFGGRCGGWFVARSGVMGPRAGGTVV